MGGLGKVEGLSAPPGRLRLRAPERRHRRHPEADGGDHGGRPLRRNQGRGGGHRQLHRPGGRQGEGDRGQLQGHRGQDGARRREGHRDRQPLGGPGRHEDVPGRGHEVPR